MLQFYLLSVLMNALAGYILFFGDSSSTAGADDVLNFRCGFSVKTETFRVVVGIVSAFTGLFKLLSSIQGDLRVIGDIVPAALGVLCGMILIFEYSDNRTGTEDSEHAKKSIGFLTANKKIFGAAAMIAAVLHFLFPTVLLL